MRNLHLMLKHRWLIAAVTTDVAVAEPKVVNRMRLDTVDKLECWISRLDLFDPEIFNKSKTLKCQLVSQTIYSDDIDTYTSEYSLSLCHDGLSNRLFSYKIG